MNWMTADLCCPTCNAALVSVENNLDCRVCNSTYPVQFGVPIISRGATITQRNEYPLPDFVDEMAEYLGFDDERMRKQINACYSLRCNFHDKILQTEADQFLSRLKNSGVSLPQPYRGKAESNITATKEHSGITLRLLVMPKSVRIGHTFTLTVVINNGTDRPLSSNDKINQFLLSYWWENASNKTDGMRTPLLIELEPGRQIANPILVKAPDAPGKYTLRIMPVIEHVRWIEEAQTVASVTVSNDSSDPLAVDWTPDPKTRGPELDHERGVQLCQEWIDRHIKHQSPRIMELGGNFNPMASHLSGQLYNVDIDPFGLMTYNIREERNGSPKVRNVVANGMQLPFRHGFFDVIMMFATFHHFPDPIGLLRHLKTRLKRNGILLLMCEPIGHVFADMDSGDFLTELRRGVYEQSFMPWEYREMLHLTGFDVVNAALDYGSLKLSSRKRGKLQSLFSALRLRE